MPLGCGLVDPSQGCSGARTRGGTTSPHFFLQGGASPTPYIFWTEIRAKVSPLLQLVTCWNPTTYAKTWLRKHRSATDTQTRVAVSQDKTRDPLWQFFWRVWVYAYVGLNCLKIFVCLVSGVPHFFFRTAPLNQVSVVAVGTLRSVIAVLYCYFWAYPSFYFLVFLFLHFFSCRFRAVD